LSIDAADIGFAITQITDELPSPTDLDRVRRRLEAIGWRLNLPTSWRDPTTYGPCLRLS
jgi:hypothetical protein